MRYGGICAVPGCSNPACELHHVIFRSLGGGDELDNRVFLCRRCHARGVHQGRIEIRGRAGERLTFVLGTVGAGAGETWVLTPDGRAHKEGGREWT